MPFLDPLHTIKTFSKRFPTRLPTTCPAAFPARFSRKNFPQDFPARISRKNFPQDFPDLDPDWLAPHHPIPNAKFPPITALLGLLIIKGPRCPHHPFPKSYGNPKSMNKLTLNEPAKMHETEKIISRMVELTSGVAPLDPPLDATWCCEQMTFTFKTLISTSRVYLIHEAIVRYENEPLSSTTLTAT